MNVDEQEPVKQGLDPIQRALERMDEELKDPNLTPEELYAIIAPLAIWFQ